MPVLNDEWILGVLYLWYEVDFRSNQLHAVSSAQQGKQKDSSVKTLRSPLSAEFWRHLRVKWLNLTLPFASTPKRRNGNMNLNKYFISSSGDRTYNQMRSQSHTYTPAARLALKGFNYWFYWYFSLCYFLRINFIYDSIFEHFIVTSITISMSASKLFSCS